MPTIKYPASSYLGATQQTSWHIGRYVHRDLPPEADDIEIQSLDRKFEHRPDLLSQSLYGTWRYWWVFSVRNMNVVRDPIWDMKTGISIYAPSPATINKVIG